MRKIIVVGGGAAGIMAAIVAAEGGAKVTLFEKMAQVGRKLRITGKGRCNLTNTADIAEVVKNIPGNGKFLYSALKNFSPADTVNFFENLGVVTKIERGGRVFPASDDASEVIDALIRRLAVLGVEVHTNSPVKEILAENKKIVGVNVGGKIFTADNYILATGGASYPATGSSGDGFKFARRLGHTVTEILPSLVPLETEEDFVRDLQGLSLKNVRVKLLAEGKKISEQFGEMLFTHFGVSGPIILTLSKQAAKLLAEGKFVELEINLKPALTPEQLDARLLRDFAKFKGKIIKNALVELLPAKLIPIILDLSYLPEDKKVDDVTSAQRRRLIENLRGVPLTITKTRPIAEAIVTAGGISVKEIEPRTMRSKLVENLFIAGEVANVDGFTGGFNLQAAWSMGNVAGKFATKSVY
ncbi:MAG: NAD(P)/FAD-dependent oxidoreductase [Quinella sp. 3Q1]|nr:NAD(P)/FAD-dependent oxidoreductase [Quinella sp. 3Q1]MBR3051334.1 NAD(P)/FAD-dependent oxidoreductase [Selenomonadaceae bacterium]MBR6887370.1 NAD(P)/FAD-dependent oxidoreductase [Selenomonadaceae bacterium]